MISKLVWQPVVNQYIRLRLLEESDLPMTLKWRNQDHIRKWLFHSDVVTPEQHQAWFKRYLQQDDDYIFVIEEVAAAFRPVGQAAIYHIDRAAQQAEFGRLMIGEPEAVGKGLARAATGLLTDRAMDTLGLREVYLEVFADNVSALSIYTACGFQITGRRDNVLHMSKMR
jgi:RimJ/RimL family protein N-acetyltransferase